jgi:hypothetical protein
MPRYQFDAGFELWPTSVRLSPHAVDCDINLTNGVTWSKSYVNDLINRLYAMHHLHWEILKVVKYSNIIKQTAKALNIRRIMFVNGLCPWDKNYFDILSGPDILPNNYTEFTKTKILNIDSRSDEDIFKLYQLAHKHYTEAGGIDPKDWVNLYDSFFYKRTDTNFDQLHPGIQSNQTYYQQVKNFLKED